MATFPSKRWRVGSEKAFGRRAALAGGIPRGANRTRATPAQPSAQQQAAPSQGGSRAKRKAGPTRDPSEPHVNWFGFDEPVAWGFGGCEPDALRSVRDATVQGPADRSELGRSE